ncbi:phospholipase-like protein [Tanacetum coccineum]
MLSSNDPPMPSKAVKELNGKRKRDDKKAQSLELRKCRRSPGEGKKTRIQCVEHGENLVGERIKVWWLADKKYYEGVVESFDFCTKKHTVLYADGDVERLDLKGQQWELVRKVSPPSDSVNYAVSHDEEYYSRDKGKKIRELDSDLEDDDEESEFAFTPEENDSENTDFREKDSNTERHVAIVGCNKSRKQRGLKRRISHKKKSVQI